MLKLFVMYDLQHNYAVFTAVFGALWNALDALWTSLDILWIALDDFGCVWVKNR